MARIPLFKSCNAKTLAEPKLTVLRHAPVLNSHSLTVKSSEPLAKSELFKSRRTSTAAVWWFKVKIVVSSETCFILYGSNISINMPFALDDIPMLTDLRKKSFIIFYFEIFF